MKIEKLWFDTNNIYILDDKGHTRHQSLLWYDKLRQATDEERESYTIGFSGIHWRNLDEDISFESFEYDDAEPTPLQRFFLEHKEINVSEFAKRIGINASLLRNYINGFKQPSKERENAIFAAIQTLGNEYVLAATLHTSTYSVPSSSPMLASEPSPEEQK